MKRLHVDLLLRLRLVDSYCPSRELLSGAALATRVGGSCSGADNAFARGYRELHWLVICFGVAVSRAPWYDQ